MIAYILKFIVASILLIGFYHLVLKNEKTFKFNRYFLLGIIAIALLAPLTVVRTTILEAPKTELTIPVNESSEAELTRLTPVPEMELVNYEVWFYGAYALVALLLLCRFSFHIVQISKLKRGQKILLHKGVKTVLLSEVSSSFSFLNHMYTNKELFEAGRLPDEIIEHEKSHISQKHSYDIILIELLTCLFWFNPAIYLIKRAIKLNHEFLADAQVLRQGSLTRDYQRMILNYTHQNPVSNPAFASHLTFGETKNRIKIMLKTTNKTMANLNQVMAISLMSLTFLAFGQNRIIAQESQNEHVDGVPHKEKAIVQDHQDMPPPPPPIMVYLSDDSRVSYINSAGKTVIDVFKNLSGPLQTQYKAEKLEGKLWIPPPPEKKLSAAMMVKLQANENFVVWIDGEKQGNAELKNLKLEDVHHYYGSHGTKGGETTFRLNIITHKKFKEDKGDWIPFRKAFIREHNDSAEKNKSKTKDKAKEKAKNKDKSN